MTSKFNYSKKKYLFIVLTFYYSTNKKLW